MEEKLQTENPEETREALPEEKGYVPRPWWQVAGAWAGLLVALGLLAMVMAQMILGGGK